MRPAISGRASPSGAVRVVEAAGAVVGANQRPVINTAMVLLWIIRVVREQAHAAIAVTMLAQHMAHRPDFFQITLGTQCPV